MEHLVYQISGTRKWRYELPNFMPTTLQRGMGLLDKVTTLSTLLYGESYRQGKRNEVLLKKQKKKKCRVKKLVLLRKRIRNRLRFYHWNVMKLINPESITCVMYRGKKQRKRAFLMLQYWQLVKFFKWHKNWWKLLGNVLKKPRRSSKLWWKIIKKRKPVRKRKQFKKKLVKKKKKKEKEKEKKVKVLKLKTRWTWKFPKRWLMWDNSWYRSWKRVGCSSYRLLKNYSSTIYNGIEGVPLSTSWWEMDYDESVKARFIRKTTKSGKIQKRVNGVIQIR